MSLPFQVLHEDNHLLVVNKPAGLATMGLSPDQPSLVRAAKQYIKQKYRKPGNVYLGIVSRLDAAASGVIVLARTSKAAARLTEQFRSREVEKTYLAVVAGRLDKFGELVDYLKKDDALQRMIVVPEGSAGAKLARLRFENLSHGPQGTLAKVQLETGRKHQIRVQFASRGHPIVGDRKYGSRARFAGAQNEPAIALHAYQLRFAHPISRADLAFTAPLPGPWRRLGAALE